MFKKLLIGFQKLIQKFRKVPQQPVEVPREYIDDPTVEVIQTNKDHLAELALGDARVYVYEVVKLACRTIQRSDETCDYLIPTQFLEALAPKNKALYTEMFKARGYYVAYCESSPQVTAPFLKIYRIL